MWWYSKRAPDAQQRPARRAPAGIPLHHLDCARWAASDLGDLAALDDARALALPAADFLLDPKMQRHVHENFEKAKAAD